MKSFINEKTAIVTEAIDGFLATTTNAHLARLDSYPHTKVVVRTDWDKSRVALVSGGGSGHEPAHAGFVGEGMLTAAVCGELFASPSVDAVLAAILAVTGEAGCLLIVKNYTGDRLNFGLAAERAKALGYLVEMVIVADDIAIPEAPQPRGVAGTLFVHKIAGYAAARGDDLTAVATIAQAVAGSTHSIGLALDSCTLPGSEKEQRLSATEVELGLGIHGEPGVATIEMASADSLVATACQALEQAIKKSDQRYVALINNLGAVPPLEMSLLANAIRKTKLAGKIELTVGPAHLMTSLDMIGFSISLMELDKERRVALTADVTAPAWPGVRVCQAIQLVELPEAVGSRSYVASPDPQRRSSIRAVCEMLMAAEGDLNALDAQVGDGDTGITFAGGARSILNADQQLPYGNRADLCAAISDLLCQNMGGSSGVLLSILFSSAGKAFSEQTGWPSALMAGVNQMMQYGGAKPGDRTMLDALVPGLEVLVRGGTVDEAADVARQQAAATANLLKAAAGRSSYVNADHLKGVVDPGAEAVARIFEVLAEQPE